MIKAVIFDLDGVIVTTDEFHFRAWAQLAEEKNFIFSREINEQFRGVSRKECLEIFVKNSDKDYSSMEKEEMLSRKNGYYRTMLESLGPEDIFPGIIEILSWLKTKKIPVAIGSSSKNTPLILEKIGLIDTFSIVVDGNQINRSKPDPEVFLLAAEKLGVKPENCLVIEDAAAGVEAALAGGMQVVGVGSAANHKKTHFCQKQLTLEFFQSLEGE